MGVDIEAVNEAKEHMTCYGNYYDKNGNDCPDGKAGLCSYCVECQRECVYYQEEWEIKKGEKMEGIAEGLIVSVSFSDDKTGVMCVGRKQKGKDVDIINAFQNEEAWELYQKLITQKKKEE